MKKTWNEMKERMKMCIAFVESVMEKRPASASSHHRTQNATHFEIGNSLYFFALIFRLNISYSSSWWFILGECVCEREHNESVSIYVRHY